MMKFIKVKKYIYGRGIEKMESISLLLYIYEIRKYVYLYEYFTPLKI